MDADVMTDHEVDEVAMTVMDVDTPVLVIHFVLAPDDVVHV